MSLIIETAYDNMRKQDLKEKIYDWIIVSDIEKDFPCGPENSTDNIGGWNNEENFKRNLLRDIKKNEYCISNKIPLIRIPYTHFDSLCLEDLLLETSDFIYYF